ncbi:hypothetical protein HPB49_004331 [Dermacentor silvarum]|uniref:Uncharacterized protein n=1 Tax=Dermacentor silvarum TaxID=543639 RepID=A0ACB8D2K1_DERSI|nr:hypothetical protein HPB49_004331 [Dermacentor silvarum]
MRTQQLTHEEQQRTSHPSTQCWPPRPRTIRQPRLPEDHAEIVVRPRNSLAVTRFGKALVRDATLHSVSLTAHEVIDDIFRINPDSSIIIISTPSLDNAENYCHWRSQTRGSRICYAPDDPVIRVIPNIPAYDTAENISRRLMNSSNPTILLDRRMGSTHSALIVRL